MGLIVFGDNYSQTEGVNGRVSGNQEQIDDHPINGPDVVVSVFFLVFG